MNPFKEVNWHPGPKERRAFATSLVIGFPCFALVLLLTGWLSGKGLHTVFAIELAGVGAGVGGLCWVVPAIAKPFYVVWYAVACCVGLVVGNVLLALVFYVFFGGIGLAMRCCGRRAVSRTVNKQTVSYWQDAEENSDPKSYYRQF
jgi:hypothetical protein